MNALTDAAMARAVAHKLFGLFESALRQQHKVLVAACEEEGATLESAKEATDPKLRGIRDVAVTQAQTLIERTMKACRIDQQERIATRMAIDMAAEKN